METSIKKEALTKLALDSQQDGGELALSALSANLLEISKRSSEDITLTITEFKGLVDLFADEYKKLRRSK